MPHTPKNTQKTAPNIFCQRLAEAMELRGMNQPELAKALGTTRQTVNNYVLGNTFPKPDVLATIARTLRVSSDYLIGVSNSHSADISTREICDRTGLTDDTVSALSVLARSPENPTIRYVINKLIHCLCADNPEFLSETALYWASYAEILLSVGVDESGHYPGTGGSLPWYIDIDDDEIPLWHRYKAVTSFERFLDELAQRDKAINAAADWLHAHPDTFDRYWIDPDSNQSGPLWYSESGAPSRLTAEEQQEKIRTLINSHCVEAIKVKADKQTGGE